jgi:hypothetical protein
VQLLFKAGTPGSVCVGTEGSCPFPSTDNPYAFYAAVLLNWIALVKAFIISSAFMNYSTLLIKSWRFGHERATRPNTSE